MIRPWIVAAPAATTGTQAIVQDPEDRDTPEPIEPLPAERPSRSARKRHALGVQRLGVRLTRLKPAQLHTLALPEELLEAVLEAQRLHSRAALARQHQYIGRLMRQIDPEPIERALDGKL